MYVLCIGGGKPENLFSFMSIISSKSVLIHASTDCYVWIIKHKIWEMHCRCPIYIYVMSAIHYYTIFEVFKLLFFSHYPTVCHRQCQFQSTNCTLQDLDCRQIWKCEIPPPCLSTRLNKSCISIKYTVCFAHTTEALWRPNNERTGHFS